MFKLPKNRDEWTVAIVSALAGFFFGGAAVAAVQRLLKRTLGIG
jgi:hypothetical protein